MLEGVALRAGSGRQRRQRNSMHWIRRSVGCRVESFKPVSPALDLSCSSILEDWPPVAAPVTVHDDVPATPAASAALSCRATLLCLPFYSGPRRWTSDVDEYLRRRADDKKPGRSVIAGPVHRNARARSVYTRSSRRGRWLCGCKERADGWRGK